MRPCFHPILVKPTISDGAFLSSRNWVASLYSPTGTPITGSFYSGYGITQAFDERAGNPAWSVGAGAIEFEIDLGANRDVRGISIFRLSGSADFTWSATYWNGSSFVSMVSSRNNVYGAIFDKVTTSKIRIASNVGEAVFVVLDVDEYCNLGRLSDTAITATSEYAGSPITQAFDRNDASLFYNDTSVFPFNVDMTFASSKYVHELSFETHSTYLAVSYSIYKRISGSWNLVTTVTGNSSSIAEHAIQDTCDGIRITVNTGVSGFTGFKEIKLRGANSSST